MKKFWNLMLTALVVLGAVACSENGDELTPQVEREGLSFEATIIMDDTRTSLEKDETSGKWNTVWSGDETLVVTDGTNSYDFVYNADKDGKFSCYEDGVESLIGQTIEVRLKHSSASTTIDSKAGMAGGSLYASVEAFDPATGVELITENSFFRFSSFTDVTLTASENIFVCDGVETNTITLAANNNAWVAFNPAGEEVTFSYSIDGVKCKSATKEFVAGKVYNLGVCNDKIVFLKPNVWENGGAWFAAHFWNTNASADITLTKVSDGLYGCVVPEGMTHVIFCRMNPKYAEFKWNGGDSSDNRPVWNRTYAFGIVDAPYNCHYVTKWGNGFADDGAAICPSVWGEKSIVATNVNAWGVIGSMTNGWNQDMKYPMVKGTDGKLIARSVVLYKNDELKVSNGSSWSAGSNTKITEDGVYNITYTTSGGSVKATKVQ